MASATVSPFVRLPLERRHHLPLPGMQEPAEHLGSRQVPDRRRRRAAEHVHARRLLVVVDEDERERGDGDRGRGPGQGAVREQEPPHRRRERDAEDHVAAVEDAVEGRDRLQHEPDDRGQREHDRNPRDGAASPREPDEHEAAEHEQQAHRPVPGLERARRRQVLVEAEKGEVGPVERHPQLLVRVQQLVVDRPERERQGRKSDGCHDRDPPEPPPPADPEHEHDGCSDQIQEAVASDGARRVDAVDDQPHEVRDDAGEGVRVPLADHDRVLRLGEPPARPARLGEVEQIPVRPERDSARSDEEEGGPAPARIEHDAEHGEQRQPEHRRDLRPDRQPEGECCERKRDARPGEQEVGAAHEEGGEDEVVERGRRLQDDDRERREEQRAEQRLPHRQADAPRDPADRDRGGDERGELDEADEPLGPTEDHRERVGDLGVRREAVQPGIVRSGNVGDRVLLLPERGTREVVPEGVVVVRRRAHDQRGRVREAAEHRDAENRDQRVARRVAARGEHRSERRRRRSAAQHPDSAADQRDDGKRRRQPGRGQVVPGRQQELDHDHERERNEIAARAGSRSPCGAAGTT